MAEDSISKGYAKGLFEVAQAENALAQVQEGLLRLRDLLKSNPNLLQFLKDPNVKREGKRKALGELFDGRVHPLILNALLAISDQDRGGHLTHIIEEFGLIAASARQKVAGEVVTAIKLDDATLQKMAVELSRITGKNVELFQRIDTSILGGAIIQVGEQIIDGSLRRRLNLIKEKLVQ